MRTPQSDSASAERSTDKQHPRSGFLAAPRSRRLLLLAAVATLAALILGVALADASAPTVTIEAAAEVGYTTAQVSGTVDPGGEPTTYRFQYISEAQFQENLANSVGGFEGAPAQLEAGLEGSGAQAVGGELTGLHPGATYHLRLLAENAEGSEALAAPATFQTKALPPPTVSIDPITTFTATTAQLSGHLNPNAPAGDPEAANVNWHFQCSPECSSAGGPIAADDTEHQVEETVEGLQPGTHYEVKLVADNAAGPVEAGPEVFTTPAIAPQVSNPSVTAVTYTEATLHGEDNPGGALTTYHFEYGPTESYGQGTPTAELTEELDSSHPLEAALHGLTPGTTYHYRLVASNSVEEVKGPDASFRTFANPPGPSGTCPNEAFRTGPSAALPDCRAFEMVTPVENEGAEVYVPVALTPSEPLSQGIRTRKQFQVAVDGSAVAYAADPTAGGFGGGGTGAGDQYLARHSPTAGWTQALIQPPFRKGNVYQGFSEDLSSAILGSGSFVEPEVPPLADDAPAGGYEVLYACAVREGPCGTPDASSSPPANPYRPLFGQPLNRTPREFGAPRTSIGGQGGGSPVFSGASTDFSERLFEVNDALPGVGAGHAGELTQDVTDEIAELKSSNYLYDSGEGQLNLIDVSPAGRVVPNATFGALPFSDPGHNPPDFSHVISADGSRVYWTDLNTGTVYLRQNPTAGEECTTPGEAGKACTVAVSGPEEARYWDATPDGHYAYYTEGGGLWRYDAQAETRQMLAGPGSELQGVIAASADGESVYFVADGVLGSGHSAEGAVAVAGQPNLYLLRQGEEPIFIATLSLHDGSEAEPLFSSLSAGFGPIGDWQPGLGKRTAAATADDSGLAFMSDQPLKAVGYPNGVNNEGADEVYLYGAAADSLYCISCSPGGEAPGAWVGSGNGAAAFLPISWSNTYLPQWISKGGSRVFFDSAVPLLPTDTNGHSTECVASRLECGLDVYEWEREGAGSCIAAAAINGGCLFLLSTGTSDSNSWLIGAGADGKDAFIATRSQLISDDGNENFDLYDARVGGTRLLPPVICESECGAKPPSPPTFDTPGGATFHGPGNLAPPKRCLKGKIRKHGRCVKPHHNAKRHRKPATRTAGSSRGGQK